jgi:hypothetical protein
LLPGLPRSTGLAPVAAPFERAQVGGVDHRAGPVELACLVQLGEQQLVELAEHAGLVPVPQPPPAGHA